MRLGPLWCSIMAGFEIILKKYDRLKNIIGDAPPFIKVPRQLLQKQNIDKW